MLKHSLEVEYVANSHFQNVRSLMRHNDFLQSRIVSYKPELNVTTISTRRHGSKSKVCIAISWQNNISTLPHVQIQSVLSSALETYFHKTMRE